jgi:transposase-like protein
VTDILTGQQVSASAVSWMSQDLEQQFKQWCERPLQPHWRILSTDGIYYEVRHCHFMLSMALRLTAFTSFA